MLLILNKCTIFTNTHVSFYFTTCVLILLFENPKNTCFSIDKPLRRGFCLRKMAYFIILYLNFIVHSYSLQEIYLSILNKVFTKYNLLTMLNCLKINIFFIDEAGEISSSLIRICIFQQNQIRAIVDTLVQVLNSINLQILLEAPQH